MTKRMRRLIFFIIIFILLVMIGYLKRDDILLSFNKQLDTKTKELMKEKLSTMEIKDIVFTKGDLSDFKEQIALDDFDYNNISYYRYFNEISKASNDLVVKKANQYEREEVSLTMIKNFNKTEANLKSFNNVLENGVFGVKDAVLVINPENKLTIANKDYYLNYYAPKQLVNVGDVPKLDDEKYLLTAETNAALTKMCNDIEKTNNEQCGNLVLTSAYRNYQDQRNLYLSMISSDEANKDYVNRPGTSEHQLGNTLDIMTSGVKQEDYDKTAQYRWIKANAAKYGFIIRYPENKEKITGIKFEPWHLRYVGIATAQDINAKNLTLEEYRETYFK